MALFKIFRGSAEEFKQVKGYHDGYAYFVEDTGELYIDTGNSEGDRKQVNAYAAKVLRKDDGETEIDIDDIVLATAVEEGKVAVGDPTTGLKALEGTGALFTDEATSIPKFGILPLAYGGTGASNVKDARKNLEVYSTQETDNSVKTVASQTWQTTITPEQWQENGEEYQYLWEQTSLTCGKDGLNPPIVTWTSNQEEYSKILRGEAEVGVGITFVIKEKPQNNISISITDNR